MLCGPLQVLFYDKEMGQIGVRNVRDIDVTADGMECLEVLSHAHTNMQVGDNPVMKYEPALWATTLYSEDSEFYSLDLRACTVVFENLILRLVFVMVLSALLDSWSHMRGSGG